SIDALVGAAAADPAGFRLLFRHASREPEFRNEMDQFRDNMVAVAHRNLAETISDGPWASWAAQLAPTVAVEAVMAWLAVGQPDPEDASKKLRLPLGVFTPAARSKEGP